MRTIYRLFCIMCLMTALVSCQQSSHYPFDTEYLPVQLVGSQKWSILNVRTGELMAKDAYTNTPSAVVQGMYYVMNDDGTYCYYHVENPKQPINKEKYGSVTAFSSNGFAIASRRGGKLEVINKQGETVKQLPTELTQCTMFCNGMAAFKNDMGLWGYINECGDTVISAQYLQANAFMHSDLAVVINASQANDSLVNFSVIDKTGNVMYSASTQDYQMIQPYYVSGVLPVVKGDTIVCLDQHGKEVPNPNGSHDAVDQAHYDDYSRTAANLFLVVKDKKMGLVDHNNKTLISPQFDRLVDISSDRYIAINDTVCHLVDLQGKAVGNVKFSHAHGGLENEVAVRGFIDTDMAVASMLMLFGPDYCCGVRRGTTLMDMNSLMDTSPAPYVGLKHLNMQQGPFIIQYIFNNEVASIRPEDNSPTFNLDAQVKRVIIAMNLMHTSTDTEAIITGKTKSALGMRGFVLEGNEVFTSEAGSAVTMGYNHGIFNLSYFLNRNDIEALPQHPRQ